MIKGIGCDIVQLSRMKLELSRRILSEPEIAMFHEQTSESRQKEFLAGRFAAKEAIQKALTPMNITAGMRDIVILPGPSGEPIVLQPELIGHRIFVSITHERSYAVAMCVIESLS